MKPHLFQCLIWAPPEDSEGGTAGVVEKGRLGEVGSCAQREGKDARLQEAALRVCSWTDAPACACATPS